MKDWLNEFKGVFTNSLNAQEMQVLVSRLYKSMQDSEAEIVKANDLPEKMNVSRQYINQVWDAVILQLNKVVNPKVVVTQDQRIASQTLQAAKVHLEEATKAVETATGAITVGVANDYNVDSHHPVLEDNVPKRMWNRIKAKKIKVDYLEDFKNISETELLRIDGVGVNEIVKLKRSLIVYGIVLKE